MQCYLINAKLQAQVLENYFLLSPAKRIDESLFYKQPPYFKEVLKIGLILTLCSYCVHDVWYFCSDHGIIRTLDLPIYITRVKVRLLFRKCHRCGSHFSWYRGVLALMTATETKASLKKWICAASNSFTLIPSHSVSLMLTNCPGFEFHKTLSKFRKRKIKIVFLSLCLS